MSSCSPAQRGCSLNGLCCAHERDRYGIEPCSAKPVGAYEKGSLREEPGCGESRTSGSETETGEATPSPTVPACWNTGGAMEARFHSFFRSWGQQIKQH